MNKTNKVVSGIAVYLSCLISAATGQAANWYPLPDTGVTKCYDNDGNEISCPLKGQPFYGQDAQYTSTNLSYTDLGDGTIKDNSTGLIWQKSDDSVRRNWQDAKDYCSNLALGGYTWRIPSILELQSVIDYSSRDELNYCPMNNLFNCQQNIYWSDTPSVNISYPENLLYSDILFNRGIYFGASSYLADNLVRCVSGEKKESIFSSSDNGSTVSDFTTQLVWQQTDDGIQRTWTDAMSYCENLTLAEYQDWRLPNIKELNTIIDRSNNSPAVNAIFNCKSDKYISSTVVIDKLSEDIWPTVKFFSFENGTSWDGSLSDLYYVRCVRGGLRNDEITAQNYQLGNVDPRSDRFSVWMDISVDGKRPDLFCSNYTLSVEGDDGRKAKQIKCSYAQNITGTQANAQYCRVDFEIDHDEHYPTAAYLENGKIIVHNNSTNEETVLGGLAGFSVYGTTFDLSKDAWNFENTSWFAAKGDAEEYRKIIADEIDKEDERNATIGGEGTREDFNACVGTVKFANKKRSEGLCYGLASSAIANFTWKTSNVSWGKGGVDDWKTEIDNHWHQEDDHANIPFKPFDRETNGLTWQDSSKMIMYYFAALPYYLNSKNTNNWVGKDNNGFYAQLNEKAEFFTVDNVLKKGRPALFTTQDHAMVLVQLLKSNDEKGEKKVYILWDNNIVFNSKDEQCPYVEWHVREYAQIPNYFFRIKKFNRKIEIKDNLTINRFPLIFLPCYNNHRDSQNIYNLWNESCPALPVTQAAASRETEASSQARSAATNYNAPDHIEVMFIGGTINGIYNQATEEKITPVFSDTLQLGQASIQSTMGGTWHLLHLPADVTYRIEATKAADTPYAEVYGTIPYPNGTVDKLHYDHIELTETNATQFSFLIGRNNSDKTLHRTGGSDKVPDYDIILDVAITPPSGFAGFAAGGQVQLSWQNSNHPKLSLVKIVRKEGGYPASPTDGIEIYSGLGESAIDNTVQSGILYYYAAFSMDSSGSYSDSAATAVDTARFAVTGLVTNNGTGLPNAKLEIRNSEQFPVAMTYTRTDGSYVLANLENGSYTVEASVFGYSLNNSPQSVVISNAKQTANFTTTAIPTLQFVFDIDKLNIGTKAQIAWKYLNINNSETLLVQKVAGETVTNLAELPASSNYFLWNVDGPVSDNVVIKISLKNNPSVAVQDTLKILPKLPATSSIPSFLPAINLLLRKK